MFICHASRTCVLMPVFDISLISDGIAYSFGSSGGLIHFAYVDNQLHNTKRDQLALGFITDQKDAVLARIDSRGSEDYIEMELVRCSVIDLFVYL